MSAVCKYRTIFHNCEMFSRDNVFIARKRQENIADFRRLTHRHNAETVKHRLNRFNRINFSNNDICAESLCTHCAALAAPAVTCNDNIFSRNNQICCAHNPVPRRLTCTVAIIKQKFTISVIRRNHRKGKFAALFHIVQAINAGCSFLTAANDIRNKFTAFCMKLINQVAAIVNDNIRLNVKCLVKVNFVLFRRASVFRKNCNTVFNKRGCNVILS